MIVSHPLFLKQKHSSLWSKSIIRSKVLASCDWQIALEILQQMRTAAVQADAQSYAAVMRGAGAPNGRPMGCGGQVIDLFFFMNAIYLQTVFSETPMNS